MSARDDYPLHRALEMLNDCPSALDEIDRLRSEASDGRSRGINARFQVVTEPIGVTYCTTHHGLREADESRGCAWQDDEPEQACQFVELYRGTEVVDTYLDPAYEEDEDDA